MRLGGTLRIESRNAGDWVLLRISDTGCGMDAATRARAFEPFFTTKGIGDGTGLGLSTVYAIVERLGGRIELRSEVGLGTSFAIYLPRTEETRAGEAPSAPIHGAEPPATGTVLLLEDDDAVRSWTRRILERSGYSVLEARNPSEAIRTAQDTGWPIDLLLADVVLPGGSGCSVAAELLAERPGLPVLYMSGYTDEAIIHLGVLDGTTPFLQKPFDPDALTKKVRELLVTR
ncbi:MAG: response regulator [Gemmatimonadota bacterium]|nr:response regulator [Gemmatimonadota bacterium]